MALKNQPFKKLFGVLKKIAPTLLAATGSPLAPLAIGIAKRVMGDETMTDAKLEEQVAVATGTTEGLAKIRQIEAELKQTEATLEIRFEELATEDRASARAMATETTIWPQVLLSGLFVVGYFVIMGLFFGTTLIVPMNEAFILMLGVLTGGIPQIMAFWLGSSSGSQRKTTALLNNDIR